MLYDNARVSWLKSLQLIAVFAIIVVLSFPAAFLNSAGASTIDEIKTELKQETIADQSDANSAEGSGLKAGIQELSAAAGDSAEIASAKKKAENYEMAIITDLHISPDTYKGKSAVIKTLNNWKNIDSVAILGDLCEEIGTGAQYDLSEKFLKGLNHKKYCVTGNHDYIYDDKKTSEGKKIRASAKVKKQKLERFKKTFSPDGLHFAKKEAGYLLVFLSADALDAKYIVTISDDTLDWLDKTLEKNKTLPTIIFCHAPLDGSLKKVGELGDHAFAHTFKKLHKILKDNKQVFMWASGHTHTKPGSANFMASENLWEKQIHVVHNPNLTTDAGGWINTLTLTPDYVLVKTFDCKNEKWLKKYERKISHRGTKISDNEDKNDTTVTTDDKNDDNDKDNPDTDKNANDDKATGEVNNTGGGNGNGNVDGGGIKVEKSNGFLDFIVKLFAKIVVLFK